VIAVSDKEALYVEKNTTVVYGNHLNPGQLKDICYIIILMYQDECITFPERLIEKRKNLNIWTITEYLRKRHRR